jgi:hypothetical protein
MALSADDQLEILRLLNRYAQTGSRQQADEWIELFVADGVWERKKGASQGKYTETVHVKGRKDLREFAIKSFEMQGGMVYQYVSANAVISGTGDRATGVSTAFIIGMDGEGAPIILVGNFEDEYHKTADGWKFAYRGMSLST